MDFLKLRRAHVKWSIEQNPTEVTINRKGKVRSGGGFKSIDEDLSPIKVRLFIQSSSETKRTSEMIGTKDKDASWGLLADHEADIQHTPDITDSFTVESIGAFVVRSVKPLVVKGEIVSYQASLERVK